MNENAKIAEKDLETMLNNVIEIFVETSRSGWHDESKKTLRSFMQELTRGRAKAQSAHQLLAMIQKEKTDASHADIPAIVTKHKDEIARKLRDGIHEERSSCLLARWESEEKVAALRQFHDDLDYFLRRMGAK